MSPNQQTRLLFRAVFLSGRVAVHLLSKSPALFVVLAGIILGLNPKIEAQVPAVPSWGIGPFSRPTNALPVITPNTNSTFFCPMDGSNVLWEYTHTFNPAAIARDGKIFVLYRAEDNTGNGIGSFTSRLGLGITVEGTNFARQSTPVFFPANDVQKTNEWYGGCEDPRLCQKDDGTYILTYTAYSRNNPWNGTKTPRLSVAYSLDLTNWVKAGPAFALAYGGKYYNTASKSGSIVQKLVKGRPVAAQINGVYWMYYGENPVYIAYSTNLLDWWPVQNAGGSRIAMLSSRAGKFDSSFAEGGPMALLTANGIVVLYNGKNASSNGDPTIGGGAYSGGQALFDANNPTNLISRTDSPYITPLLSWEKSGQYPSGTTFTEGLAYLNGQWFLYYGSADSYVGVAMTKAPASLTLSPANTSIAPNDVQQFAMSVYDASGNPIPSQMVDATWAVSAGGGTIDGSGLYTAPTAAGSATVSVVVGTFTNTASVNIIAGVPLAPTGLSAAAVSSNHIQLAWIGNDVNETGFDIERKVGVLGAYNQIGLVGAGITNFTDSGLATSTTYYYRVRATNAAGGSAYSSEAFATTTPLPAATTDLQAWGMSSRVVLTWSAATNAVSYNVKRSTVNGGSYVVITNVAGLTFTDLQVTNGVTYYYVVTAVNSTGESGNSLQAIATPRDNLALNHSVTASSLESSTLPASNAVDGSISTRWASARSDPQWISVDLGSIYLIDLVRLQWETAYGLAYQIQLSTNGTDWTTNYATTNGTGGVEILTITPGLARYVRMYGTQRATSYGYSLWEFEIYGTTPPPPSVLYDYLDGGNAWGNPVTWNPAGTPGLYDLVGFGSLGADRTVGLDGNVAIRSLVYSNWDLSYNVNRRLFLNGGTQTGVTLTVGDLTLNSGPDAQRSLNLGSAAATLALTVTNVFHAQGGEIDPQSTVGNAVSINTVSVESGMTTLVGQGSAGISVVNSQGIARQPGSLLRVAGANVSFGNGFSPAMTSGTGAGAIVIGARCSIGGENFLLSQSGSAAAANYNATNMWTANTNISITLANAGFGAGSLTVNALRIGASTTLDVGGNLTLASGGLLFTANNAVLAGGTITAGAAVNELWIVSGFATTAINSVLTDNGTPVALSLFSNPGDWKPSGNILLGAANTHSGVTRVGSGQLLVNHSLALQNSTLDMQANNLSVGGVAFNSGITNAIFGGLQGGKNLALTNMAGNPVVLGIGNNNSTTVYSGSLSGGGSLVKMGAGMLTLAMGPAYTGDTTVSNGTLVLVPGAQFQPGARVTVDLGGTLAVGQPGAVWTNAGTLTVAGGTLNVCGAFANAGTLRLTGTAQLMIDGTFTNQGVVDIITWGGTLPAGMVNNGTVLNRNLIQISPVLLSGNIFQFAVPGYSGHAFQIQSTTNLNLGNWIDLGSAVWGANAPLNFAITNNTAIGAGYYRVKVAP